LQEVTLPLKKLGDRYWILLNDYDDKFLFRASGLGKGRQVKDLSDHRAWEIEGKGSPKCSPKNQNWDISKLDV
jgi:hypothetical protein